MSAKTEARNRAFLMLGIVILIGVYAVTELRATHWRSGFGAISAIAAFVLWLILTKVGGYCGVKNATRPGNCAHPITGLFFGCTKTKGRAHMWQRPLGFVGLGRKAAPRRTPARGGEAETVPAFVAPNEAVQERMRNRVLFYATMTASTFAVLSGLTDVFTFFGKTAA